MSLTSSYHFCESSHYPKKLNYFFSSSKRKLRHKQNKISTIHNCSTTLCTFFGGELRQNTSRIFSTISTQPALVVIYISSSSFSQVHFIFSRLVWLFKREKKIINLLLSCYITLYCGSLSYLPTTFCWWCCM